MEPAVKIETYKDRLLHSVQKKKNENDYNKVYTSKSRPVSDKFKAR